MDMWKVGILAGAILIAGFGFSSAQGPATLWQISGNAGGAWKVNVQTGETYLCLNISGGSRATCKLAR